MMSEKKPKYKIGDRVTLITSNVKAFIIADTQEVYGGDCSYDIRYFWNGLKVENVEEFELRDPQDDD